MLVVYRSEAAFAEAFSTVPLGMFLVVSRDGRHTQGMLKRIAATQRRLQQNVLSLAHWTTRHSLIAALRCDPDSIVWLDPVPNPESLSVMRDGMMCGMRVGGWIDTSDPAAIDASGLEMLDVLACPSETELGVLIKCPPYVLADPSLPIGILLDAGGSRNESARRAAAG